MEIAYVSSLCKRLFDLIVFEVFDDEYVKRDV